MRVREKKFFHDPLTAGEKLFKLELSIQEFLLLGPVRLLPPLASGPFLFYSVLFLRIPARNIPLRFPFNSPCAVGSFFVIGL